MQLIKNKKGQSLIEYLVLICLVGVGSMAVVRVVGKNVRVQFANVARSLGGEDGKFAAEKVEQKDYAKKDFSDFMEGSNTAK